MLLLINKLKNNPVPILTIVVCLLMIMVLVLQITSPDTLNAGKNLDWKNMLGVSIGFMLLVSLANAYSILRYSSSAGNMFTQFASPSSYAQAPVPSYQQDSPYGSVVHRHQQQQKPQNNNDEYSNAPFGI